MYYPIIRGRQYDLLALRTCVENKLIGEKIIPILEPVKATPYLFSTLDAFVKNKHEIALVLNPVVGDWDRSLMLDDNLIGRVRDYLESGYVSPALTAGSGLKNCIKQHSLNDEDIAKSYVIFKSSDDITSYMKGSCGSIRPRFCIIPDKSEFRRLFRGYGKILCEDHFNKQERNADYIRCPDEAFSNDHLYYEEEGYQGFSDYSVIGSAYKDTGFAPTAVAIHVVYLADGNELRIQHFVSDTNGDIRDPAKKYAEALTKLKGKILPEEQQTYGYRLFLDDASSGKYFGLGIIKQRSIMHHLELMNRYLEGLY